MIALVRPVGPTIVSSVFRCRVTCLLLFASLPYPTFHGKSKIQILTSLKGLRASNEGLLLARHNGCKALSRSHPRSRNGDKGLLSKTKARSAAVQATQTTLLWSQRQFPRQLNTLKYQLEKKNRTHTEGEMN